MISDLLRDRQKAFLKKSLKYLRLIFNDHFTVLLIFLLGAGGFFYRDLLIQVSPKMIWLKLFLTVLMTGLILIGQPASHLQEADALYLLPKLRGFISSFKKFAQQLFLIKLIALGIVFAALYPLFYALTQFSLGQTLAYFALVVTWQGLRIYSQLFESLRGQEKSSLRIGFIIFLSLSFAILNKWWISLLIVTGFVVVLMIRLNHSELWTIQHALLHLIALEETRKQRIYRFFAMVRDVPQVNSKPIKNTVLNHLIKALFPAHNNRVNFLMPRLVFRQASYFNLIIRLIVVGSVLIFLSAHTYLSTLFAILFHWLILYQLLPLVKDFRDRPSLRIHRIKDVTLVKGLQNFYLRLSLVIIFVFTLVGAIANKEGILVLLAGEFMFIIAFVYVYLPAKVRRLI